MSNFATVELPESIGASTLRRILIVDDDEGWVELLETMLAGPDVVVCRATDPEWAVAIAKLYEIDLAILDWKLGHPVSGLDLGRRLRSIRPGLECILMSGHPAESVQQRARAAGFSRFLGKPFDVDSLRRAMAETLGETR